jgi:hypothetical protein
VRTAATIALLGAAIVLLCSKGTRPAEPAPIRGEARDWSEATEWAVLCPQGRGVSPVPIVALATPGWLGAVEVTIETPRRTVVSRTGARSLGWPEALPPLAIGEWCTVIVSVAGEVRASSSYLRIAGEAQNQREAAPGSAAPVPESGPSDTMPRARERRVQATGRG